MRILLKSTLLELTDALREYARKRMEPISKVLKGFEEKNECTLDMEVARTTRHHRKGDVYYIEITLPLPKKTIRIEQYGDDLRVCIDSAQKRCMLSVKEYKEKAEDKRK